MQGIISRLKWRISSLHAASGGCVGCLFLVLVLLFGLTWWGSHLKVVHKTPMKVSKSHPARYVGTIVKETEPVGNAPTPSLVVTQTFDGPKSAVSYIFQVGGNWHILWSCDVASNNGKPYAILINVMNPDGSIFDYGAVDTTCTSSSQQGTVTEKIGGYFYLDVTSESQWQAQIEEATR